MRVGLRKALVTGGAVAAIVLAAGLINAAPAQASASQGYVIGSGDVTDDFGDEGTLRRGGAYANSGATGLWQWILYADGYLTSSDIDCEFGPTTEAATKKWQAARSLTADGIVGTATFGYADWKLYVTGQSGETLDVRYSGTARSVYFTRNWQGKYSFRSNAGTPYYMLPTFYTSIPTGC
ncbi:peptidoglycan-binding protein [Micromonospora sp. NPDC049497]|uniref:peptidoglycan-binding protein n=1 Tax=Micromonospora sp. NPDC049497 TaxID=3364273 RepID=UPI003792EFC6